MTGNVQKNYCPPAPSAPNIYGMIWRIFFSWRSDILHYLPARAFNVYMSKAPASTGRNVFLINDPGSIREVMIEKVDNYPKSDFVTAALDPLVGDSIFTVSGDQWRRQHRMVDQVFAKLRLKVAYASMQKAVAAYVNRLDACIGKTVNLDEEMAFVTADVIFRTMFSRPIEDGDANTIFREFTIYQESLPHMTGRAMFRSLAHTKPNIPARGLAACARIREIIASIVDERLSGKVEEDDICQIIVTCRDPETNEGFTREEMINQIAFFFLAGHETSASALTWALLCLSQDEVSASKLNDEVRSVSNTGDIPYDSLNQLKFTSSVFKESLRLYPPVAFITRHALKADNIRGFAIAPNDLVVISPWVVQRNSLFWEDPGSFKPERFENSRTGGAPNGTWIPFSAGTRVCTGAAFANAEAALILGTLTRRYRFTPVKPEKIRPVCRLTIRPERRMKTYVSLRDD